MTFLAVVVLAAPPAAFWLWFFLRRNRYRPIPLRALVGTFGLGMLATIPSFLPRMGVSRRKPYHP